MVVASKLYWHKLTEPLSCIRQPVRDRLNQVKLPLLTIAFPIRFPLTRTAQLLHITEEHWDFHEDLGLLEAWLDVQLASEHADLIYFCLFLAVADHDTLTHVALIVRSHRPEYVVRVRPWRHVFIFLVLARSCEVPIRMHRLLTTQQSQLQVVDTLKEQVNVAKLIQVNKNLQ